MSIELSKDVRNEAIRSIERYFQENMDEAIGNLSAGVLLDFFLQEIGPVIYNMAVADAQENLTARVMDLDIEVHKEAFQYWAKIEGAKRKR